jgi:hypothetical protein
VGAALSLEIQSKLEVGLGLDLYIQDGGTRCTRSIGSACRNQDDPMQELLQTVLFVRRRL